MTIRRKIAAVAAGSALLLGAAACSDDAQNDAKDKANEATSAAGDAAGSATSAAGSAVESAKSDNDKDDKAGSDKKDGDADDHKDSGKTGESDDEKDLPADIKTTWENEGGKAGAYGMLKNVDKEDGMVLATFQHGWVTYSKDTGAVPLKGKIGETWAKDGGLKNKLGLPTAPEKGTAAEGWTQTFQHGVLKWAKDASGKFGPTVMDRN